MITKYPLKFLKDNKLKNLEIEKPRKNFFGTLKGIGSFTRKDRMNDRKL